MKRDLVAIGPATKADAAYAALRDRILDASLAPGTRLDQEELASVMGVSTTPLREALRRLEVEELVQRTAHKDVVIPPLRRDELRELYLVRIELDSLALRMAADCIEPDEIALAAEILDMTPADGDEYDNLRLNRSFHRVLYRASRNAVLIALLEMLWDRTDRYRFVLMSRRETLTTALEEHREMLEAVAARDGERAAQLMRDHLRASWESIDAVVASH